MPEPHEPLVSVVIPAIAVDDLLLEAVSSALGQTWSRLEVVVVLDGATGDESDLPVDPRLLVVRLERRSGTPVALNTGIAASHGEFVARLDADDLAEPQRIARQMSVFAARPELVALGSSVTVVDAEGAPLRHLVAPTGPDLRRMLLTRNALTHSATTYRRAAFDLVGGYDTRCTRMQDYDLWLRLATVGPIDNVPEALISYRVHEGQHSRRTPPWGPATRSVLAGRRRLAAALGSPPAAQRARDAVWIAAQFVRHVGLRRPRYLPSRLTRGPRRGVLLVTTADASLDVLYAGQLRRWIARGVGPLAIASADTGRLAAVGRRERVSTHALPLVREPAPVDDVRALRAATRLLLRLRPAVVVYGTPKASLVMALAATIARVPRRVHVLHGLRLETQTGLPRRISLLAERLVAVLSTETVAVSRPLVDVCRELGIPTGRTTVLGHGSVGGVDVERFEAAGRDPERRRTVRSAHGLDDDDLVVGFVGRASVDKGLVELVSAVDRLRREGLAAHLVIVGPDEGLAELPPETRRLLGKEGFALHGPVDHASEVLAAFDAFCLPSHREGLGSVVLEASCAGVPVVVSDAPALAEVVRDGVTGLVVPRRDDVALADALRTVLTDRRVASALATAAAASVAERFDHRDVWDRAAEHLLGHLSAAGAAGAASAAGVRTGADAPTRA